MHLEYRTNNAYDSVLLVQDDIVRSDWTVTRGVMKDYCDCSQDATDWDDRGGDEHTPDDYGELVSVRTGYELNIVNSEKWRERVEFFCH